MAEPAPEGGRQVRRQVLHRELPLAEVLRRLPHRQEGRAGVAQAEQVAPAEVADGHHLRTEARRGFGQPCARSAEVGRVVRGLSRRGRHPGEVLQGLPPPELPHPDEFKKNHVSSKSNPANCKRCHTWRELCSNCHHIGSSFTVPWIKVHGGSSTERTESCLKCHGGDSGTDTSFCVKCHQSRKVAGTRRKSNFIRDYVRTRRSATSKKERGELHICHSGAPAGAAELGVLQRLSQARDAAPGRVLRKGKGKAQGPELPEEEVQQERSARTVTSEFCNGCHHEGAPADKPWVRYHRTS